MSYEKAKTNGESVIKPIGFSDGLLSTQTAAQINDLIKSGALQVGERLPPERELSERLEVSRTIVREAIKLLKASGLVRVRQGVGIFITEPSMNILEIPMSYLSDTGIKKINDLQEVRDVIEPTIAALAAKNAGPEHITKMENAISEMDRQLFNGQAYIQADNAFHIALAEACNNSVFQLLLNSIVDLLQESRKLAVSSPGAAERANIIHRRVLEAIKSRNSDDAYLAMDEHMEQIKEDIQTSLHSRSLKKNTDN